MTLRDVMRMALSHQGAPYVWGGKGLFRFDKARGIVLHGFGVECFDCSGLVTVALREAGGPDLVSTANADVMFRTWEEATDPWEMGVVRLYGVPARATHAGFAVTKGLVLEAAGGDATTDTPERARYRGARVAVNFEMRHDFLGARRPPLA